MNRCFSAAHDCRGEMTERFCREGLQECLPWLHLPCSGAGIPQCEPCLPAVLWSCAVPGVLLHSSQQCGWAPETPSRHRPRSSQQPGPCGEGVPLSAGCLVSESLLEQMSAVLRALQPSLLCCCSAGPVGFGPAVEHLGQGRVGDTEQGCRSSTGGHWAVFSHQL